MMAACNTVLQTLSADYEPDRWIAVNGHTRERVVDTASQPRTWDTLDWTEVARPEGALS